MKTGVAARHVTAMIAYELPHLRAALRSVLAAEPDLVVLAEADDLAALLPHLGVRSPDVLVVGRALPVRDGDIEVELARRAAPRAAVVLVGLDDRPDEAAPERPGEPCYVPLGCAGSALADAVRAAAGAHSVVVAER